MANRYKGFIHDSCSWGVIVAWQAGPHCGEHEEFRYNNYFKRQELYYLLDNNLIAGSYEDYVNGEIKE